MENTLTAQGALAASDQHIFELEQKIAELTRELEEQKQRIDELNFQATLLSSVQDAVVAVDQHMNLNYWNGMAEKLLGWSAHEMLGQSFLELFHVSNPSSEQVAHQFDLDNCYVGEHTLHHKDGMVIQADTRIKYFISETGQFQGAVASFRDITQRKKEEEEFLSVKNSLGLEVEALTNLHALSLRFFIKDDLQNTYEEILDAAVKFTHADNGHIVIIDEKSDQPEVISYQGLIENLHDSNEFVEQKTWTAQQALKSMRRIIIEDTAHSPLSINVTSEQLLFDEGVVSEQSTPMISSTGNLLGILTTKYTTLHRFTDRELRMLDLLARQAADAIERTKAEEAIHQSERRALALVGELRKMDENKTQFLNSLSHELRNPLASIMMSLTLLDQFSSNRRKYKEVKEVIHRQAAQLSHLVDDLLDVTRITRNMITLKKMQVELNEQVFKAVGDYREDFKSKGIRLETKFTPDTLFIEADPARLNQVIGNLLHNALKFTPKGGYTRVTVGKDSAKNETVIEVEDNGVGIRPDMLHDLFLPFIQVDTTLDRNRGGLGLGLAIVKSIVELHAGSVTVSSKGLGEGTKFSMRLPLLFETNTTREEKPKAAAPVSKKLRILVIDDIPDIAEILCSLLRILGHEVISANDGIEGIAKAKDFLPEVILCDIGLPKMNGYEVAESLRRDHELKNTYLIAVSGYAQPEDIEKSKKAGFDLHLAKPVDLAVLEKILANTPPPPPARINRKCDVILPT